MISSSNHGRSSVFRDIYNQTTFREDEARQRLIRSTKDSLDYVQRLDLQCRLNIHLGCVNTVCWNDTGEYILSGSDDQCIAITNPYTQKCLVKYKTTHRSNIFSARFLPQSNDRGIVSCSGDGMVLYTELTTCNLTTTNNDSIDINDGISGNGANLNYFNCHNNGTTYEVMTVPSEPNSFMSCGEDGTVRFFDLRQMSSCHKTCCKDNILIFSPSAITAMTLSPLSNSYIAIGSSDSLIRIYDRRYLSLIDFNTPAPPSERHTIPIKAFTIPTNAKRSYRVTSVEYSTDETDILVSYSSDYLYLFDCTKPGILNSPLVAPCPASIEDQHLNEQQLATKKFGKKKSFLDTSPPPVRKLRLRGDWSDTGPNARPERDIYGRVDIGQVRPQLHGTIMHRMTEVLSRMLNDPQTRSALNGHAAELPQHNQVLFDTAARAIENYAERNNDPQPGTSQSSLGHTVVNNNMNDDEDDDDDDDDNDENNKTNNDNIKQNYNSSSSASDNIADKDNVDATALKEELEKIEIDAKQLIFDYVKRIYKGHRNARTMIKEATFWGNDYIMSGSDCGYVFIWERKTGKLVKLLQADEHVVNCLRPHPTLPLLATSGIDYNVKIWAPLLNEGHFDEKLANDLMERNAVMLEETKDTITVPAAFMIRMLACIHTLRYRNRSTTENNNNNNNTTTNDNSESNQNNSSSNSLRFRRL